MQEIVALGLPLTSSGERFRYFGNTAAAISQLDLIIIVEIASAHLAGALGKPAWVLLTQVPAWCGRNMLQFTVNSLLNS